MSNEVQVVEAKPMLATFDFGVKELGKHLEEFKQFIAGQLVVDQDFGLIPGCGKKPSLFKPGAEKLLKLFGFKIQLECTKEIIDYEKPLGLFRYKASVGKFNPQDGQFYAFGECEAICSTEENKYKYKAVWTNGQKTGREVDHDRMDKLNTIAKMSQKRAIVGATILACGASEYFTQDLEDMQADMAAAREESAGTHAAEPERKPAAKQSPPASQSSGSNGLSEKARNSINALAEMEKKWVAAGFTAESFWKEVTEYNGRFCKNEAEAITSVKYVATKGGKSDGMAFAWMKKAEDMIATHASAAQGVAPHSSPEDDDIPF